MGDRWDPAQYNKFAAEREQPFWDLVRLLDPVQEPTVVDLGCGDGRLTAELGAALGAAATTGIDSSKAMIDAAGAHAGRRVRFTPGDIGRFDEESSYEVVFANASLQWVPDHPAVLARWTGSLRGGGQLAVQVPANADHPAHRLAGDVAAQWLEDPPPDPVAENVLSPEAYAQVLHDLGFAHQHVRLQVYPVELPSTSALVEWVKGTTLTRLKAPLGDEQWERFVDAYRGRLLAHLGDRSPFFYPFKRILFWGRLD